MFLFLSEMFNVSYMTAPLLIMLATTKASIPVHQISGMIEALAQMWARLLPPLPGLLSYVGVNTLRLTSTAYTVNHCFCSFRSLVDWRLSF
jgi:hypothetical protein